MTLSAVMQKTLMPLALACRDLDAKAAREAWILLGSPDLSECLCPSPFSDHGPAERPLDIVALNFPSSPRRFEADPKKDLSELIHFLQGTGCQASAGAVSMLMGQDIPDQLLDFIHRGLRLDGLDIHELDFKVCVVPNKSYLSWNLTHCWSLPGESTEMLDYYAAFMGAGLKVYPFPPSVEGAREADLEVLRILWPESFGEAEKNMRVEWDWIERASFIARFTAMCATQRRDDNWKRRGFLLMCCIFGEPATDTFLYLYATNPDLVKHIVLFL